MLCNYVWDLAALTDPKYAVIWSGVIGAVIASGISYFGVRSANKSSLARLTVQLAHDADEGRAQRLHDLAQNNEERKASFRRNVYLDAASEVVTVIQHLSSLPQFDKLNTEPLIAMTPYLKATSKVWMVAEPKAAHLALELRMLLVELGTKALAEARNTQRKRAMMEEKSQKVHQLADGINRLSIAAVDARIIGEITRSTQLQTEAAQQQLLAQETEKELKQLADQWLSSIYAYSRFIQNELTIAQETIVKTVCALREELHLEPDAELFAEQLREEMRRSKAVVEALINSPAPSVE